ncbi:MAG: ferredoxin [Phycisphaerales bacterium]|nr:MAG: ferredoxin [Phycisphaerales bacterium]
MDSNEQSTASASSALPDGETIPPVVPSGQALHAMPELPVEDDQTPQEQIDLALHAVRRYHRGDPGSGDDLTPPGDSLIPALLHPYRDPERIRHDYPLFLFPSEASADRFCQPLSELLTSLADSFAPGEEDAKILKDNFSRLERLVREDLGDSDGPISATERLADAARSLADSLKLSPDAERQLKEDVEKLIGAVPEDGSLLGLSPHAPLHLFFLAARHRAARCRSALRRQIVQLRRQLRDILLIDLDKEPEGREPTVLGETVGEIGTEHFDPAALARVLGPARGAEPMEPARRKRIQGVIKTLEKYLDQPEPPLLRVVQREGTPRAWKTDEIEWHSPSEGTVCAKAAMLFDQQADKHARLYAAMRVARLELVDAYDPPRHDHLLAGFDWEAFSHDELLALPPVLALEPARQLAGEELLCLSRLQLSGRPVSVLVLIQPAMNPGVPPNGDPLMGYRFELAYLGISHREALVHQSSAARPDHLVDGFHRSLESTRASLHVVATGLTAEGDRPSLGDWLHAGAALEGRAHPFFHYDPGLGTTWARRFDFSGNPQPESDWPVYALACRVSGGGEETLELAFSFADFALLEPSYRQHFRVIPPECRGEELITVDAYLTLSPSEALEHIPYTWAVDDQGRLHRLVITRRLAFACRDRLNFWRTMQELAGIRNEYVKEAVERERRRVEEEFASERQQLQEAQAAELERVKTEAASEVLQRLAAGLVQGDLSALTAAPVAAPRPGPAPPAEAAIEEAGSEEAEAAPQMAAEEEEEDEGPAEPWIDSILCTTCNDCTNLNPQLFVYNGNKQAMIGDPRAGTYAQLVEAASKCPSRCIHPGKPLNPDEPNLEELIERAKPFN